MKLQVWSWGLGGALDWVFPKISHQQIRYHFDSVLSELPTWQRHWIHLSLLEQARDVWVPVEGAIER